MKRPTAILDAVSIFSLILLILRFLLFELWGGGPGIEIVLFVFLAIIVGAIVHLLCLHGDASAFLFVAYIWIVSVLIIPVDMPYEPEIWEIVLTITGVILVFSFPLIYMYWIRKRKCRAYFKICAWIYVLGAWIVMLLTLSTNTQETLQEFYRDLVRPLRFASLWGLLEFAQLALFVPVSGYLTYRLITGTQTRDPAELSSEPGVDLW